MPTVVVGQVIARDDAAWLRAQRVHLPPVAAAGRVRVGDLIGRDVVVATATCRVTPAPANGHSTVARVGDQAVLERGVADIAK